MTLRSDYRVSSSRSGSANKKGSASVVERQAEGRCGLLPAMIMTAADRGFWRKECEELSSWVHAMQMQLAARLGNCIGLGSILDHVLDASLELTGATLGNIQLMDWRAGYLTIEAQ